jgi:hypothetical protein
MLKFSIFHTVPLSEWQELRGNGSTKINPLHAEFSAYTKLARALSVEKRSTLGSWKIYEHRFPIPALVTRRVLYASGASCDIERLFSRVDLICSALRIVIIVDCPLKQFSVLPQQTITVQSGKKSMSRHESFMRSVCTQHHISLYFLSFAYALQWSMTSSYCYTTRTKNYTCWRLESYWMIPTY